MNTETDATELDTTATASPIAADAGDLRIVPQGKDTRRADPMEARAREMAVEAGLDPDGRVPHATKPDRTQPIWVSYRNAVRAEKTASRTAELAAHIEALQAQPPEFQNAPLRIFGEHDPGTISQMRNCMKVGRVVAGSIEGDGHVGYAQPVGAAIAYDEQISVSGVGFDIGCGNLAVCLDVRYADIAANAATILADIRKHVSFGVGRSNAERAAHPLFDDEDAWRASTMEAFKQKAEAQLGTVGSGNHYVDLFEDERGLVWIGVHFGSRGLGHTSATKFLKLGGGREGVHVPPTVFDVSSELGQAYLAAMELAGRYAYAGREWVVERVRQIIGGSITDTIHNHHNYAWKETHGGREVWVVRKGCTPAFPGQRGFVGGSMADNAVILRGVDCDAARESLYSTIHGAGRTMSRTQAFKSFTMKQMEDWLREKGVILSGGALDESPMAYRRLAEVIAVQGETVAIEHTLRPFVVAMAGGADFDPYKEH